MMLFLCCPHLLPFPACRGADRTVKVQKHFRPQGRSQVLRLAKQQDKESGPCYWSHDRATDCCTGQTSTLFLSPFHYGLPSALEPVLHHTVTTGSPE
jgi:hypothetical protein